MKRVLFIITSLLFLTNCKQRNVETVQDSTLIADSISTTAQVSTNELKEVKIGTQVWATTNLNVSTFRNGEQIMKVEKGGSYTEKSKWSKALEFQKPAYCDIDGDPNKRVYNSYALDGELAPAGWHIPTKEEWQILIDFLGGEFEAPAKLKSTYGWFKDEFENYNGTNESGFNASPTPFIYSMQQGDQIDRSDKKTRFFTSSFNNHGDRDLIFLGLPLGENGVTNTRINITYAMSSAGYPVRCIKD